MVSMCRHNRAQLGSVYPNVLANFIATVFTLSVHWLMDSTCQLCIFHNIGKSILYYTCANPHQEMFAR